jgi:phosphoribosylformylglycinamidine (FGAM) synthase-like amidotransferase family enzyme
MPHPERFIDYWQHPRWTRRGPNHLIEGDGLQIFRSAVASLQR